MENSSLVKNVLGSHMFEKLVENKKKEWEEYRSEVRGKDIEDHLVTLYEQEKFLPML